MANLVLNTWSATDPLAHETPYQSTYNYMGADPANLIDPGGTSAFFSQMDAFNMNYAWDEGRFGRYGRYEIASLNAFISAFRINFGPLTSK